VNTIHVGIPFIVFSRSFVSKLSGGNRQTAAVLLTSNVSEMEFISEEKTGLFSQ